MKQQTMTLSADVTHQVEMEYMVFLPDDYDAQETDRRWPLIVFLHGAGERGGPDQLVKQGLPKKLSSGDSLPFVVVAPCCNRGEWWLSRLDQLDLLLRTVLASYNVDPTRVYLTGLSMGGNGAWHWAAEKPDQFAAVVPICGFGIDLILFPDKIRNLANKPIWTFHGEKDTIVSIAETERIVKALRDQGSDVKFTVYPDLNHDSWTVTYDNPELYDWLLQHQQP